MKNKYQKALNSLISKTDMMNNVCAFLPRCLKCGKCQLEFGGPASECEDYVFANTLQELVDKETPMKPIKVEVRDVEDFDFNCFCPKCNEVLWDGDYCCQCGQKIDWSDE